MDADQTLLSRKFRKRQQNMRYDYRHHMIRKELAPFVQAGLVSCARCGEPIEAGAKWDLGHDDLDPRFYSGPEHSYCNQTAPHRNLTSRQW
jgi:hypothetical protein